LISKLERKPSVVTLSVYLAITMMQYFFRLGMRNKFATIKFGAAFLGFSDYNFFLHGFLTLLATYTAHILAIFTLPYYLKALNKSSKSITQTTNNKANIFQTLLIMFLVQFILNLFTALVAIQERYSLRFPGQISTACLFNLCHTLAVFILGLCLIAYPERQRLKLITKI
jgi:hypothetical protein